MGPPRALIGLGALAIASTAAVVAFDIIFAITLFSSSSIVKAHIVFIVGAGLGLTNLFALIYLLSRQLRCQNGAHIRELGTGKRHMYLLAGLGAVFAVLQAVASVIALGMVESKVDSLPQKTYSISTKTLLIITFATWAVALVLQTIFLICMVVFQIKAFQRQMQSYESESLPQIQPQMQEPARPRAQSAPETPTAREKRSLDSGTTPPSSRSSISQVVRPMNSRTRLIPGHQKSLTNTSRPPSIDSAHQEIALPVEEGFDSWDTSSVDPHSVQVVESVSPTPPRFLETIPASPTGSRSPSPGCPLDLNLPKLRKRSRSFSPATSTFLEATKSPRSRSPAITPAEANIHPLFRTDSPTPPTPTPGTVVTAAPGAGLLFSDRQSIRSIHRIRSGSLPSSPLLHSSSLDSFKRTMDKEAMDKDRVQGGDDDIERKLTPPIPDWILGAGGRESMSGYNTRKQPPMGLGVVGEAL